MAAVLVYNSDLQKRLKEEAIAMNACEKGISSWGQPTLQDLCDKFHEYQDFCIKHDWPKLTDFDSIPLQILADSGIFYCGKHNVYAPNEIIVLGDAEVTIKVPDYGEYSVYARHNAKIHLDMHANSHVYISMHNNCEVDVVNKIHGSRVACSHFGGKILTPHYFDKINEK